MEASSSQSPENLSANDDPPVVPAQRWLLSGSSHVSSSPDRRGVLRSWLIAGAVFIALLVLGLVVYPYDMPLFRWIHTAAELPGDIRRVLALSELVAHGSGVVILLAVIWRLAPHLRYYLPRIACSGLMAGLVANGLKLLQGRYRPLTCPPDIVTVDRTWRGWFPSTIESLDQPYGYVYQSFPSAHTATAFGFAIGLAWLFPKGRNLFFAIAVFAGLQRVAFSAHWPSDVLFGAAIGVLLGSCFTLRGTLGSSLFDRLERYWMFAGKTPIQSTESESSNTSADDDLEILPDPDRRAA